MNRFRWFIEDIIYKIKDLLRIRYETPHKRLYDNGKREETFTNSVFCDFLYVWLGVSIILELVLFFLGIDAETVIETIPILSIFYDEEDFGFMFWPTIILGGESIFMFFREGTPLNSISSLSLGVISLISCILAIPLLCWIL